MHKETITFVDYNGVERTEDHFFNFTKAELMEMQMGTVGGFTEMIQRIVAEQNAPAIIEIFKDLILRSYGQMSPDGRKFIKNPELRDDFAQTEAYSQLFMKLATDADAAAKFVNNIVPADMKVDAKTLPNFVK